MRKKKREKLKLVESITRLCFLAGVKDGTLISEVPPHVAHFRGRTSQVIDEDLIQMPGLFRSIDMLHLDNTEITSEGIKYLAQLDRIQELRLKDCSDIDNDAMQYIVQISGLELLHLGGTKVTIDGLKNIPQLQDLKKLLVSSNEPEEVIKEKIGKLQVELPGCEFIVNHKTIDKL